MNTQHSPIVAKTAGRMIEPLEGRQMLSVTLHDGVVHVTGTEGHDAVHVFATAAGAEPTLTVEIWSGSQGTVCNFALTDVSGVEVDGRGGNDEVIVDGNYEVALAIPVTLLGGGVSDAAPLASDEGHAEEAADHAGESDDDLAGLPAYEPGDLVQTTVNVAEDLFNDDSTIWGA